ncbi:MAG: aminotransferase class V-fold PLP-dependent enzyme, partial [Halanaerobiaceae bacterium]
MDNLRQYIAGTETRVPLKNGKKTKYINFDNAATTPPLKTVLKKIKNFAPWYSSIHRGKGYKSRLSSEKYEMAREIIANFLGADSKEYDIIFVKNTTAAINKLAWRLQDIHPKKDIVLTTEMEHHSNDLPWRKKYRLIHIRTNKYGRLDLGDLESKLIKYKNRVKLVTVTGASNITGYINPIYKIAGLAHSYGALIMVDGAQLVPHRNINLHPGKGDQIDFLAFSGHKMYAPFG